jgi:hypothetical protein
MRYEITVSKGRKTILRMRYKVYEAALSALADIEEQYGYDYTVEFKDTQPFTRW